MSPSLTAAKLYTLGLAAAAEAIATGRISARALADAQLARIATTDAAIDAWAHLDPAHVRAAAGACDRARAAGATGTLCGIGIGVKDIVATVELPTQMGSPVYAGHRPAADAECVARLKKAGGFVFGKTVTTAFAFLDPGKTRNPWNPAHTPGGSSSGSAAAVAAGHVTGAIGTQTNGSVIRPAAYCGVVGFKPTRGAIPLAGVHLFSGTLDQVGTFTRSVGDAARLASVLADPGRIAPAPAPLARPPRLAYLGDFPWTTLDCADDDTREAAATTLRRFTHVEQVDVPAEWRGANLVHRTIMLFEAAELLSGLQDRERARLSPKLNAALDEGRGILRADYVAAMAERERAIASFTRWCDGYDAVLAPAATSAAPKGLDSTGDPACATLWSLLGFPALTVPVGRNAAGLPIGLQIATPSGADDRLLAVAAWAEEHIGADFGRPCEPAPPAGAARPVVR
jgi:Asp-tRNA(Asn)/Glu-tRNA(Gln) amidotransferase A subunit family amidase